MGRHRRQGPRARAARRRAGGCLRAPARAPGHPPSGTGDGAGGGGARHRKDARVRAVFMDADSRRKLIEQYKDGYRVVAEALVGADDEELGGRPAPGKWSARDVVHHLADSEMTAAVRARLLIAADRP